MQSEDVKSAGADGLDDLFTSEPPKPERAWQICFCSRVS